MTNTTQTTNTGKNQVALTQQSQTELAEFMRTLEAKASIQPADQANNFQLLRQELGIKQNDPQSDKLLLALLDNITSMSRSTETIGSICYFLRKHYEVSLDTVAAFFHKLGQEISVSWISKLSLVQEVRFSHEKMKCIKDTEKITSILSGVKDDDVRKKIFATGLLPSGKSLQEVSRSDVAEFVKGFKANKADGKGKATPTPNITPQSAAIASSSVIKPETVQSAHVQLDDQTPQGLDGPEPKPVQAGSMTPLSATGAQSPIDAALDALCQRARQVEHDYPGQMDKLIGIIEDCRNAIDTDLPEKGVA